jgi:hypothetical protein
MNARRLVALQRAAERLAIVFPKRRSGVVIAKIAIGASGC